MKKALFLIVIGVLAASAALLITGKRILLSETEVKPGDSYFVPDYGNLGESTSASLVCKYFTGRSVLTRVFWYSPNNIVGKDECPFTLDRDL